jgi:hypothetical protein
VAVFIRMIYIHFVVKFLFFRLLKGFSSRKVLRLRVLFAKERHFVLTVRHFTEIFWPLQMNFNGKRKPHRNSWNEGMERIRIRIIICTYRLFLSTQIWDSNIFRTGIILFSAARLISAQRYSSPNRIDCMIIQSTALAASHSGDPANRGSKGRWHAMTWSVDGVTANASWNSFFFRFHLICFQLCLSWHCRIYASSAPANQEKLFEIISLLADYGSDPSIQSQNPGVFLMRLQLSLCVYCLAFLYFLCFLLLCFCIFMH